MGDFAPMLAMDRSRREQIDEGQIRLKNSRQCRHCSPIAALHH
jgi:hypothetical protein